MNFAWLKTYMPRSLFGRALLILLVPLITLQLIVATGFIQRHFDGVTRQLATGVGLEISAILERVEADGALSPATRELAEAMNLDVTLATPAPVRPEYRRRWYDVSGRTIRTSIAEVLDRPIAVDLAENSRAARIRTATSAGVLDVEVARKRMSASNPHQLLVIMIFSSIVLTLISLLFLRNQVRPITRLAQAAEAFGKGHNAPFRPAGAEEVRRAGVAFLSMRQRIERHLEQRTLMLSGVSHDLRTPLTRMKLALETAEGADDIRDLARDIEEMEGMIDGFLDFAADTWDENAQPVDIADLVRQLMRTPPEGADPAALSVIGAAEEFRAVTLRPSAIRRAVQNLINNAHRYGKAVRVTLRASPRTVAVEVEDDGPGIPAHAHADALKPFFRLDAARNQDKGGATGLGLAIALDAARTHGGKLTLDRSPDLGGLKAVLSLPR